MLNRKSFLRSFTGKKPLSGIFALLALILLPAMVSSYWVYLATEIAIDCLFALSLNMLFGYTGMVSFGHSAYFALGAYTSALLVTIGHWAMPASFAVAPFVAAGGALIGGIFCIRRSGVYFLMLTLAIAQVLYSGIYQWYSVTGGDNGIVGVLPAPVIASPLRYYYFTLTISLLAGYCIYRIVHSPFGYSLKAIRDNARRAEAIGINVPRCRLVVFIMAGFFAGIGGTLYGFFNAAVFPHYAFWLKSAEPIMATILGGPFHFAGPIIGAAIITLLRTLLTRYVEYWMLVLGLVMVGLIMFFRMGITGIFKEGRGGKPS